MMDGVRRGRGVVVGVLYAEFGYVHKNNYPNIFDLVYMYLSESYSRVLD